VPVFQQKFELFALKEVTNCCRSLLPSLICFSHQHILYLL